MPEYRIVGTAGHIDHGKSALVRALTGVDPDRLREEKERGITIDLGFAHVDVGEGLRIAFIDVPGHERFVKNMLAGIGGIDAVLLVVAADESIMPQTREHFAICRLLGIEAGVVAITKCDLVESELVELVELEVGELLEGTPLEVAPVVHTSAAEETGLEELREALAAAVAGTTGRSPEGIVRLPVDRVFTVQGFGTVVTGTLLGGRVAAGDTLELLPEGREVTVRGIQMHGAEAREALPGQRTALNLQGIGTDEVDRGMVLAGPGSMRPTHLVDARLRMLPHLGPLEQLQRVRFHHGAVELLGRVAVLEGDAVAAGDSGLVQLRLEAPYPLAPGDRFILRRYSPLETIGGGVVLDPLPDKHGTGDGRTVRLLRELESTDDEGRLLAWVREAGAPGLAEPLLAQRLACTPARLREVAGPPREAGLLVRVQERPLHLVAAEPLDGLVDGLLDAVAGYHRDHPLRPAMPKEAARAAVAEHLPPPVFEAALERAASRDELRIEAEGLARPDHRVRLEPPQERFRARLLARLEEDGMAPPTPEEALREAAGSGDEGVDADEAREILHLLLRRGELVRIRDDYMVHAEAVEKLVDALRSRFPRGAQLSVSDFKEWAGLTRKHAIPLLEHLDAERVTRRVGDLRERL